MQLAADSLSFCSHLIQLLKPLIIERGGHSEMTGSPTARCIAGIIQGQFNFFWYQSANSCSGTVHLLEPYFHP